MDKFLDFKVTCKECWLLFKKVLKTEDIVLFWGSNFERMSWTLIVQGKGLLKTVHYEQTCITRCLMEIINWQLFYLMSKSGVRHV